MKIIPIRLSVTTCYLIPADSGYVLVDTGYEEDWELFQKRLKETGVGLSQVSHVVLTHHHDDHCGLLQPILRKNGAVRVVMSDLCEGGTLSALQPGRFRPRAASVESGCSGRA